MSDWGAKPIAVDFPANRPRPSQFDANVRRDESARVRSAAAEFEATFLAMLLKEMRQPDGDDGMFAGDSGDVLGGLFDQTMGLHLAAAGGVGLAASLSARLEAPESLSRTPSAHGSPAPSTGPFPRTGRPTPRPVA